MSCSRTKRRFPTTRTHGVTENMSEIGEGAPEGAMDLVREFY